MRSYIFFQLSALLVFSQARGNLISFCPGQSRSFSCSNRGDVIIFQSAFWGKSDQCGSISPQDICVSNTTLSKLTSSCFRKSSCYIDYDLMSIDHRGQCPTSSTELVIDYLCVPDATIRYCANETLKVNSQTFIHSGGFPSGYPKGYRCMLQLSGGHGMIMKVTLLYLKLRFSPETKNCDDPLVFKKYNPDIIYTVCDPKQVQNEYSNLTGQNELFTWQYSLENTYLVEVSFEASQFDGIPNRGFLFKVEVFGCSNDELEKFSTNATIDVFEASRKVTYKCPEDYDLIGPGVVECDTTGWIGNPGMCNPKGVDLVVDRPTTKSTTEKVKTTTTSPTTTTSTTTSAPTTTSTILTKSTTSSTSSATSTSSVAWTRSTSTSSTSTSSTSTSSTSTSSTSTSSTSTSTTSTSNTPVSTALPTTLPTTSLLTTSLLTTSLPTSSLPTAIIPTTSLPTTSLQKISLPTSSLKSNKFATTTFSTARLPTITPSITESTSTTPTPTPFETSSSTQTTTSSTTPSTTKKSGGDIGQNIPPSTAIPSTPRKSNDLPGTTNGTTEIPILKASEMDTGSGSVWTVTLIGLSVGIIVLILLFLLIMFLVTKSRRRKRQQKDANPITSLRPSAHACVSIPHTYGGNFGFEIPKSSTKSSSSQIDDDTIGKIKRKNGIKLNNNKPVINSNDEVRRSDLSYDSSLYEMSNGKAISGSTDSTTFLLDDTAMINPDYYVERTGYQSGTTGFIGGSDNFPEVHFVEVGSHGGLDNARHSGLEPIAEESQLHHSDIIIDPSSVEQMDNAANMNAVLVDLQYRNSGGSYNSVGLATIPEEGRESGAEEDSISSSTIQRPTVAMRSPYSRTSLEGTRLPRATLKAIEKSKVAYPLFKDDDTGNLENYLEDRRGSC